MLKVKYFIFFLALVAFASCLPESKKAQIYLTDYVNPFVGTDGPGNTYPGASMPFGMVQLSPDNGLSGWDRIAGYFWPDSTIAGFSHLHLSGTGAGDLYDILVMPLNHDFSESLLPDTYRPYSKFRHEDECAKPGYYKVLLESSGIIAELTTTERVGFHKYSFPTQNGNHVLLDLGYSLNWDAPIETVINVESNRLITGKRISTGWASDQRVFFALEFSEEMISTELFQDDVLKTNDKSVSSKNTRLIAHFENQKNILVKVALSSVSTDNAKENLEQEIPHWDFDQVKNEAQQSWEAELGKIRIEGSDYQKRVFYSNLYRCFLTPNLHSDANGQYKGANGITQHAKGFKRFDTFSLWDTYRAAHPLYTILQSELSEDFIASLLAHYDETGLLPVWSMHGNETNMMIGYHAVPVIVDAFRKGIPMDTLKAFQACVASANEEGRGIDEYKKLGYVPYKEGKHEDWSVSKTLEYAFNDWCIGVFAEILGDTEQAELFLQRANNWKHVYDAQSTFMRPKDQEGLFLEKFRPEDYSDYFCESNAWHYFWSVQHDIQGLIDTLGAQSFKAKLDSLFAHNLNTPEELPIFSTGMIGQYAHGNEPSHHVAYLYNYLDEPERTQELIHEILNTQYNDQPNGYCGNEDCGQMSSWLVLSAMGFYPVNPANGIYDVGSPWIPKAEIRLSNGKSFKITTANHSAQNIYVQKVLLNGQEINNWQLSHRDIMNGGELHFIMGSASIK